ncbi:MAG: hypothetical protein P8J45_05250 [Phycisphaerales bacterium]|nr:hypothetical protein [Phycisphaerales bacterium]
MSNSVDRSIRIYKEDADLLVEATPSAPCVMLLPQGDPRSATARTKLRIQWGQHLLDDLVNGCYRTVVCGVNAENNTQGLLGELLKLIPTSQWTLESATSYAKMFRDAVSIHAREDREPYVLKFDLDRILILALLRPAGRDHFTLEDLYRGFKTIAKMMEGRRERQPAATVSFLGAKSNRLLDHQGEEPPFEAALEAIHKAGFEGDIYPPVELWNCAPTGVFGSYPFPDSVDRMRQGSS